MSNKVMLATLATRANNSITVSGKPKSILLLNINTSFRRPGWTKRTPATSVSARDIPRERRFKLTIQLVRSAETYAEICGKSRRCCRVLLCEERNRCTGIAETIGTAGWQRPGDSSENLNATSFRSIGELSTCRHAQPRRRHHDCARRSRH